MARLANAGLSLMLTGLVVGALALAAFPAATGTRPVTIVSNSMQDTLPTGSLVYIRPETAYPVGSFVTFPRSGAFITHQVIAYSPNPRNGDLDGTWLVTKGTNSPSADEYPVEARQVEGQVHYFIPWAGAILKWLAFPVVWAFLGLLAAGLWYTGRDAKRTHAA